MLKNILKMTIMLLLLVSNSYAEVSNNIPEEHPDSRYKVHNNGTVTDNVTGLMWQVCSQGQTWMNTTSATCTGTASTHDWQAALNQADTDTFRYTDWRLPNIKELGSITAYNRQNPSINEVIFPNTPANDFWSSSPKFSSGSHAWLLNFNEGNSNNRNDNRTNSHSVRLVRFGE